MPRQIPPIAKGQGITARRLNEYGDNINQINNPGVRSPRQVDDPGEAQALGETQSPSVFVESAKTTSQVQVFDDEGTNYALIDRFDKITLVNGDGKTLELQFNN